MNLGKGQEATKTIFLKDGVFHFESGEFEKILKLGYKTEATWFMDTPEERKLLSEEQLAKLQSLGKIGKNPDGSIKQSIILGIVTKAEANLEKGEFPKLLMTVILIPDSKSAIIRWVSTSGAPPGQ